MIIVFKSLKGCAIRQPYKIMGIILLNNFLEVASVVV